MAEHVEIRFISESGQVWGGWRRVREGVDLDSLRTMDWVELADGNWCKTSAIAGARVVTVEEEESPYDENV